MIFMVIWGAFTLSHGELERETRTLTGGEFDEVRNLRLDIQ